MNSSKLGTVLRKETAQLHYTTITTRSFFKKNTQKNKNKKKHDSLISI